MGYRLRIGRIPKSAHEKYGKMRTEDEVIKAAKLSDGDAVYRSLPEYQELYELGKYCDFSEGCRPFFVFELEENDFHIVTKEWLIKLIETYHKNNADWYSKLLGCLEMDDEGVVSLKYEPDDSLDCDPSRMLWSHLNSIKNEWVSRFGSTPYNLEPGKDGPIVSSWKYEYSIFNLVHILHTFDWENDLLIYSGW